jgi:HD superfamily phosphodiesterase
VAARPVPKLSKPKGLTALLAVRYPGLIEKVRARIVESERRFAGNAPETDGSFLWEHTVHVAALAAKLAAAEKLDPGPAAVIALFHDAGKFIEGGYHESDRPEEEDAALVADALLRELRVKAAERKAILSALRALYNEKAGADRLADTVHDADFLSKSGHLGVAAFFTKATLRGQTLRTAVMNSLSKELTYAAALPRNVRTRAARAVAETKAADALRFYEALLRELREVHDIDFNVRIIRIPDPRRPGLEFEVRLVLPRRCETCGGAWRTELALVRGLKCETVEARVFCSRGDAAHEISFCLPELG